MSKRSEAKTAKRRERNPFDARVNCPKCGRPMMSLDRTIPRYGAVCDSCGRKDDRARSKAKKAKRGRS